MLETPGDPFAVPSAPGAAASESGTLRHGDEGQGQGDRHWRQPKVGYAQRAGLGADVPGTGAQARGSRERGGPSC